MKTKITGIASPVPENHQQQIKACRDRSGSKYSIAVVATQTTSDLQTAVAEVWRRQLLFIVLYFVQKVWSWYFRRVAFPNSVNNPSTRGQVGNN
jgi:hypothetical protein